MKKFLIILIAVAIALLCCGCFDVQESQHDIEIKEEAYRDGYLDGYDEGYEDAYDERRSDFLTLHTGAEEAIRIWESLDDSITSEYIDDDDMMMYLRGILEISEELMYYEP